MRATGRVKKGTAGYGGPGGDLLWRIYIYIFYVIYYVLLYIIYWSVEVSLHHASKHRERCPQASGCPGQTRALLWFRQPDDLLPHIEDDVRTFDWSVCLLTLKHLVSLQARTRPSVQTELDLWVTTDERREIKKRKFCISTVTLNVSFKETPHNRFFFPDLPKWCVHTLIIGVLVSVCTLQLFPTLYPYSLNY